MELTEFLTARIAEDEALARAATPGPWRDEAGYVVATHVQVTDYGTADVPPGPQAVEDPELPQSRRDSAFIARWDPTRVLAECEARRRIVDVHKTLDNDPEPFCWNCDEDTWPCKTMAALALPYADHADYDERWRP